MLVVVAMLVCVAIAFALFVHALRADRSERAHGWLVVVPLLIVFGWVLEVLITG